MTVDSIIIGADSLIGRQLLNKLRLIQRNVTGTSREKKLGCIQLDINEPQSVGLLPEAKVVYFCAAINGFDNCTRNPSLSVNTNVISTLNIARKYIAAGSQFVFLSSSSVFGDRQDSPSEKAKLNPNSLYGFCKMSAEVGLQYMSREFTNNVAIIRLTKVLSNCSPFIKNVEEKLNAEEKITTIANLFFSPISVEYASRAILAIGEGNKKGIYHFSGDKVISQTFLAKRIALQNSASSCLIEEQLMEPNVNFNQCNHLSMKATEAALNFQPQSTDDLVNDLLTISIGENK